jgi:hypothetical protein
MADYAVQPHAAGERRLAAKVREREFQNVDRTDEDIYWGQLRFRPIGELALSMRAESSSRDASEYQAIPSIGAGAEQNPLLRKYYLTDRDRNLAQVQAEFSPAARLSLSARYERAKDRYDESVVGWSLPKYDQISAEASVQLVKALVHDGVFQPRQL